jgi:putative two-component system response regulator
VNEAPAARLLVVDDEHPNVVLLERLLTRAGYTAVTATTDPRQAIALYCETRPDLVLLDLHMPGLDGFAVMERLEVATTDGEFRPILVLTADVSSEAKHRALRAGASDFVTKPFDPVEVTLRVKNLLQTRRLHEQVRDHNRHLEERVRERTAELSEAVDRLQVAEWELRLSREETITRLAAAAEYRDEETGWHIERMSRYTALLASRLGLEAERTEALRLAASMHDVGKIGVPDRVLLKPGPLTSEEFAQVKEHATIGHRILAGSDSDLLELAATIAWSHHERWDGTGYPRGLAGSAIPYEARMAAVADMFDALTSDRVYRPAVELDRALDVMREGRGTHLDPELFDVFVDALDDVVDIMDRYRDERLVAVRGRR